VTTFVTTTNLQRKVDSDTETKIIERENKKIMWIWKIKSSHRLSQNGCQNIISLNGNGRESLTSHNHYREGILLLQCQQPFAACIHKWNIHHLLLYRFSLSSLVTIFIMDHTLGAPSFLFYSLCDIFFNKIIHYILLDHHLFVFHPLSVLFDFDEEKSRPYNKINEILPIHYYQIVKYYTDLDHCQKWFHLFDVRKQGCYSILLSIQ